MSKKITKIQITFLVLCVLFTATAFAQEETKNENVEETVIDFASGAASIASALQSWSLIDVGQGADGAELYSTPNALVFKYPKSLLVGVAHNVDIKNFRRIRITLKSKDAIMLSLGIMDNDGATFACYRQIPANRWTTVTVRPRDFAPDPDSPVKKERIDPGALSMLGYAYLDVSERQGGRGKNTIQIREVRIERTY